MNYDFNDHGFQHYEKKILRCYGAEKFPTLEDRKEAYLNYKEGVPIEDAIIRFEDVFCED